MVDEHRDQARHGTASSRPRVVRRISPSAVLAGAILALVILFMLNLLGVGLGLTTIDPGRGGDDTPPD